MDLILVPGNSPKNKEWIEEVKFALAPFFDNSEILYYSHWQTGGSLIDFGLEMGKLVDLTSGRKEYAVLAKSVGVLLTLKAVFEKKINPSKCFFLGTALLMGQEMGFPMEKWLKDYPVPTIFIHKSRDPVISADKLKRFLKSSPPKNYEFVEIPGDNHDYENINQLREMVTGFLWDKN